MNTTTLAKTLGVSTKTIHRWIKHFNLTCRKNENGHYIFDETNLEFFAHICEQMRSGIPVSEMNVKAPRRGIFKSMNTPIEQQPTQKQFASLLERIEQNERKIEDKASEVVSYQLLQQRREIEELNEKIKALEEQFHKLQTEKNTREYKKDLPLLLDNDLPRQKKVKRKGIIGLLF